MHHTILFTIIPRGITTNSSTLPVSITVTPRLFDGKYLGKFPDWLNWAQHIKQNGLSFVIKAQNEYFEAQVNTEPLQPELWEKLFNAHTPVTPYEFQDYSDRNVYSYPVRNALSIIKNTYQQAAVSLALPIDDDNKGQRKEGGLRLVLDKLLGNYLPDPEIKHKREYFAVSTKDIDSTSIKDIGKEHVYTKSAQLQKEDLTADGLLKPSAIAETKQKETLNAFAAFQGMPQPEQERYKPLTKEAQDFEKTFDFHQAIASLQDYPALQRALGLVFDIEIPEHLIPTTANTLATMCVYKVMPGWGWEVEPEVPELHTAYWYFKQNKESYFLTAVDISRKNLGVGLLHLNPMQFGIAQIDVDGGLHKLIQQAESFRSGDIEHGLHQTLFDNTATLPSLRSGGISLFADERALQLLTKITQTNQHQQDLTTQGSTNIFYAQDLFKGYRFDIWDDFTKKWQSLHQRNEIYTFGETPNQQLQYKAIDQEGYVQLSATSSVVEADKQAFYLHEAIMRWAGWSLSVPFPSLALNSSADPKKVLDPEEKNEMATTFKMQPQFSVVPGSLPALRFGRRYKLRARLVDIAGNSLPFDHPLTTQFANIFATPTLKNALPYLRFEPIDAPIVVVRKAEAITGAGSKLLRIVIRSFNDSPEKDTTVAPDLTANDRLILPPRTSVEVGERLGMFDDLVTGKLRADAQLYQLLATRDGAELKTKRVKINGERKQIPFEANPIINELPYLPDIMARGAAFRNLPGAPESTIGKSDEAPPTSENPIPYQILSGANPRKGSATLISYKNTADWKNNTLPFRIALNEGNQAPSWDENNRLLTVYLPKGQLTRSLVSSYALPTDLEKMGIWHWLKSYINDLTINSPENTTLNNKISMDKIEHILQRCVEGGHWMLTPPQFITFVHAVQQPIGTPSFEQLPLCINDGHRYININKDDAHILSGKANPVLYAWREMGATDLSLVGGLKLHLQSSAKVEIYATWTDPIDNPSNAAPTTEVFNDIADEIPLQEIEEEEYINNAAIPTRRVGYLLPNEDLIIWAKEHYYLKHYQKNEMPFKFYYSATPQHQLNDTKHHLITYTAKAASRFKEYFENADPNDKNFFTRTSAPVTIHVPATSRPVLPQILYIIPTFGWQRQFDTDTKRSVRFGGGLRIYLDRPWFSSGADELLGIVHNSGILPTAENLETYKPFITQWGGDPVFTAVNNFYSLPSQTHFVNSHTTENDLYLEELATKNLNQTVNVSAYQPQYDETRQLWYCDITVDVLSAYMPFIRLALARYQPYALPQAKLSQVVIAEFIQVIPNRSLVLIKDSFNTNLTHFTLSGVAPDGPVPNKSKLVTKKLNFPHQLFVSLQKYNPNLTGELAWEDAPASDGIVVVETPIKADASFEGVKIWKGSVNISGNLSNNYRLVFEERVYHEGEPVLNSKGELEYPSRTVYLETIPLM
ncbi:MAG: hypothetical protein IPI59_01250 [Sphingobacteriales bacterium]|nr:hypothetical protein [Sphingobacteriales bacterium]MBK7526196.1 hypothetical protein [Sphingobacteriales bacterium]MBK8677910.1 hypothetical protein [Sphingobacteriales bacterium]